MKEISRMQSILDYYKDMVPFLGKALGSHCEVALLDCENGRIIAIANGTISGRSVGAPITDMAKRIIEREEWKYSDYTANYAGYTTNQKLLRSSSYFIKEDGRLIGILCINVDTSDYQRLVQLTLSLGGLTASTPNLIGETGTERENFIDSITDTMTQVMREMYGDNTPEQFKQDEKIDIVARLNEKGVFNVKGSVGRVAKLLGCSEPSIYRYISKLAQNK